MRYYGTGEIRIKFALKITGASSLGVGSWLYLKLGNTSNGRLYVRFEWDSASSLIKINGGTQVGASGTISVVTYVSDNSLILGEIVFTPNVDVIFNIAGSTTTISTNVPGDTDALDYIMQIIEPSGVSGTDMYIYDYIFVMEF